ncbi:MAG: tetratricopeptide repeat protein [Chlamydiales bacterium]|nr:tetratricopeptide repeat protein [Chlamydiales bacterium]
MSSNISISSLCIGAGAAAAVVVSVYESNSRSNIGGFLSSLWTGAKEEQKTALDRQFRVEKDDELLTPAKFKSTLQTPHSDSSSAITEASNSSYTSTVVLEDFVTAEFEEAIECLKVIRQSGSNEGLEYKFGEIKHAFHSYIKVFPRNDEALLALADLHYEMGEFSLAVDYYKSHLDVLESDNFLYVWDKLGECLTYLDNFREAKEYFESCIEYDSDYIPAQFYYGVCLLKEGKDIPKALKYLEHVFKLETLKTGPESWDSSCVYYYAKALEKMAALASSSADKNEFSRKSNEIFGYYQVLFPRGAFAKEVKAALKAHEALLKEEQISIDPELLQYDDCLEELADCLDRPALEARIRGAKEARERELMGKEESATRLFKAEEEYQSAISDAELGLKKIELAFASGSFDDLDHLQEPLAEKEVATEQLSEEELELMEETYGTRDPELVALFKSAIDL